MSTAKRVRVIFGGDGLRGAEPGFHPAKAVARGTPVTLKTWGVQPQAAGNPTFSNQKQTPLP